MLAPIWLRAAHRGVPTFLVTALLLGQSPMALAEPPRSARNWSRRCASSTRWSAPSPTAPRMPPSSRESATTSITRGCWLT